MDKGYDSEEIHTLIREEIKADSIVPLRERKRKRINGKYRKQLHTDFDNIRYNRRNIVETIISMVKRKFGETLRARKVRNQVKEVKVKLIVYNINKKVIEIIWIKLGISTEPKYQSFNSPRPKYLTSTISTRMISLKMFASLVLIIPSKNKYVKYSKKATKTE